MRTIFYLLCFIFTICFISCNDNKNENADEIAIHEDPRTDFSMQRTHEDTTTLFSLADQFLLSLKQNDIEGALDQLYEIDGVDVRSLSNERRNQLRKTLSSFPVVDYSIDQIVLYSDSDTEIRYSTEMFKLEEGNNIPNKTKGSLHPYRIDNKWYLTIQTQKNEPLQHDEELD